MPRPVWKDTPASTAEQIEISLREGNLKKAAKLETIIANCNFAIANTDNAGVKQFAEIVLRLASAK